MFAGLTSPQTTTPPNNKDLKYVAHAPVMFLPVSSTASSYSYHASYNNLSPSSTTPHTAFLILFSHLHLPFPTVFINCSNPWYQYISLILHKIFLLIFSHLLLKNLYLRTFLSKHLKSISSPCRGHLISHLMLSLPVRRPPSPPHTTTPTYLVSCKADYKMCFSPAVSDSPSVPLTQLRNFILAVFHL